MKKSTKLWIIFALIAGIILNYFTFSNATEIFTIPIITIIIDCSLFSLIIIWLTLKVDNWLH